MFYFYSNKTKKLLINHVFIFVNNYVDLIWVKLLIKGSFNIFEDGCQLINKSKTEKLEIGNFNHFQIGKYILIF